MASLGSEKLRDEVILVARVLLIALFLIFGWGKLTDFSGTVGNMARSGVPMPTLSALVAIAVEFLVSIGIILGVTTRPLAILLALYTLATAFIGHHYWTMTDPAR